MLATDMSSHVSLEEPSLMLPKHSTFLWLSVLCVGLHYTWDGGGTCWGRCRLVTVVNQKVTRGYGNRLQICSFAGSPDTK